MDLDGINNRQWNAERVIVFQTVVLQRVCLVSGSKNLLEQIFSHLDLWSRGTFGELVQDLYRAREEFLGNNRGTQTQ